MAEIQVFDDHRLLYNGQTYRCALGENGLSADKVEGDGTTPTGRFFLRRVFYRADRIIQPITGLPVQAIELTDGWCDAPEHPLYNQQVQLPFGASHEELWRSDHIYDIIVVLSHNENPVIAGAGSAVFFHLARPDYGPTKGCVAVSEADMRAILKRCDSETIISIEPKP